MIELKIKNRLQYTPFPYLVINNFLEKNSALQILVALKKQQFEHKECDLFSLNQTKDFIFVKDKVIKEFYNYFKSNIFLKNVEKLFKVKLTGKLDMAGSLYKNCDYLLCHDDDLENRMIAFVYYLSGSKQGLEGGEFLLYDSNSKGRPEKDVRKIMPKFNSILFFKVSTKSFHEVSEIIKGERYAIGGWLS